MGAASVLLVEDSPSDVELTCELLAETSLDADVHVARDGQAALDFLRRAGVHADAPRPDLVVLDLNLPRRSGREVLAAIKGDADLERIPVIVLTTSRAEDDEQAARRHRADCFLSKPLGVEELLVVAGRIDAFWRAQAPQDQST